MNSVYQKHVFVCTSGEACTLQSPDQVFTLLRQQLAELGLKKQIRVNKAGCLGQCGNGLMVVVYPDAVWYAHVKPEDCQEIVQSHLVEGKPVERLLYDGRGKITETGK